MKKNHLLCMLGSLFFIMTNAIAGQNCAQAFGNMIVGKVNIHCLKVVGKATFNGTTIQENLDIIGSLNAISTNLNTLNIIGDVSLQQSTISGIVKIKGRLEAADSTFANNIEINTQSVTFNHSKMKNIKITSNKVTYVYLNNQSIVEGNIEFTNKNGIIKNNNSKVTGKIIGGKME